MSGFKQTNAGQMRGQRCEKEAACKLPDIGLAIAVGSTIGHFSMPRLHSFRMQHANMHVL